MKTKTLQELVSDLTMAFMALGMARGLLQKLDGLHKLKGFPDNGTLNDIDRIIDKLCYEDKRKTKRNSIRNRNQKEG